MRIPLLMLVATSIFAQTRPTVVDIAPTAIVTAKAGALASVTITLKVDAGYHVNSNKPAEEYLIPLTLTWEKGPLKVADVIFPNPQIETLRFSGKPVSVFTGEVQIVTRFKIPRALNPGKTVASGKLHYQACNDRTCLTPRTIEVHVPVEIVK